MVGLELALSYAGQDRAPGVAAGLPRCVATGEKVVAQLPDRLLAGIPQQPLCGLVPEHDPLIGVHRADAVRGVSEKLGNVLHPRSPYDAFTRHRALASTEKEWLP